MAEGPETQTSTSSSINSSSQDSINHPTQVPTIGGLNTPNSNIPFLPTMYPALVPGLFPPNNQEQTNRGPGLYAVQVHPFMQPFAGFTSNNLIPLTYNIPTSTGVREVVSEQGVQPGEQPQQQLQAQPEREVVWRFQIDIPIDLFLILRLAAVVFLFSDGSKQRLTLLVCSAILFYLYQTGILAPLVRRLSQRMQRVPALPQPPRAVMRANNLPAAAAAAGAQGNENGGIRGALPVGENENEQIDEGNRETENEHAEEPGQGEAEGNRWWGIVNEVKIIVFGFIASLLPGYHND